MQLATKDAKEALLERQQRDGVRAKKVLVFWRARIDGETAESMARLACMLSLR